MASIDSPEDPIEALLAEAAAEAARQWETLQPMLDAEAEALEALLEEARRNSPDLEALLAEAERNGPDLAALLAADASDLDALLVQIQADTSLDDLLAQAREDMQMTCRLLALPSNA